MCRRRTSPGAASTGKATYFNGCRPRSPCRGLKGREGSKASRVDCATLTGVAICHFRALSLGLDGGLRRMKIEQPCIARGKSLSTIKFD